MALPGVLLKVRWPRRSSEYDIACNHSEQRAVSPCSFSTASPNEYPESEPFLEM
jgi:hypothetical protein